MNAKTSMLIAVSVCSLLLTASSGFSQGALTPPPGPPAPTMLTLSQIEPRTPIATNTTPGDANNLFIISQPGSYYLTANVVGVGLESCIEILANNVTLDLQGFNLQGTPTNAYSTENNALYIPNAQTNITVRNGSISGWAQGVFSPTSTSANLVFEHLNCANCYQPATADSGMNILGPAVVRDCTFENDNYGVSCNGYSTTASSLITGCTANDCGVGIACGGTGVISGCTANNNAFYGVLMNNANAILLSGCAVNNSYYGVVINGAHNRVEDNHIAVGSGSYGIYVGGAGYTNNIIIRNSVIGGGGNDYYISGPQIIGPMITTAGTVTSANPWANFSF